MASYVLFDTETTGNQDNDRIIQIGALIVHAKDSIESYDELCSTQEEISIEAMEVHNITPDMLDGKPSFRETSAYKRISELNKSDNYLIAHNISFDLGMLEKEGFDCKYRLIDTLRCAKHLLPLSKYHRLQYLRYSLDFYKQEKQESDKIGIVIKAHDAISDVIVMKLLLSKLVILIKEQYPAENPMHKLASLTETPVMMQEFKFGKYKGQMIADIASSDTGYIKWMINNMELDDDMSYTLRHHIEQSKG